jgi:hypothetical protein
MIVDNHLGGRYVVDGKIFYDKIAALVYADSVKKEVQWDYFNDIFFSADWAVEPELSLDELYRIRAQQLRDKYDYIVIFCSGGADSTNVLYSFLKNGIHVDEVYAGAPISGLKQLNVNAMDTTTANVASETFLAQIPILEKVKSEYPDLKITVNDYFDDMLNYKEDDWLLGSSDWIHPSTKARYSLEKYDYLKKMIDQGKTVACIYGSNKPNVTFANYVFNSSIEDLGINVARPAFNEHPCYLEPFYTTPAMPEIVIKQSHVLAKYATLPQNKPLLEMMKIKALPKKFRENALNPDHKMFNNRVYEDAIIPAIYPSLDYNYFQGDKPNIALMADHDAWFYSLVKDEKIGQMIVSDVQNFKSSIGHKYFATPEKTFLQSFRLTFQFTNIYKINSTSRNQEEYHAQI